MRNSGKSLLLSLSILMSIITIQAQTKVFNPFNGFHFGYTGQIGITKPVELIPLETHFATPVGKPGLSWNSGIEASYHFAKYFGVSLGLNIGRSFVNNIKFISFNSTNNLYHSNHLINFSLPIKFEIHVPIKDRLWFYSDLGIRLTGTSMGIEMGSYYERYWSHYQEEGYTQDNLLNNTKVYEIEYEYEPNIIKTDILFDLGFYYKLPYSDLIRVGLEANIGLNKIAEGNYNYTLYNSVGTMISHDTHFDFQLSYIHNFKRAKEKLYNNPNWNQNFPKHELMVSISDSYVLGIVNAMAEEPLYSPTYSLSYHYRMAKWFWLGCAVHYTHFNNTLWEGMSEDYLSIMANLRFSYLNKEHLTLYSGIALGISGARIPNMYIYTSAGLHPTDYYFNSFQLTALGVKVGGNKWFGDLELGVGYKGFVSLGAGYNL